MKSLYGILDCFVRRATDLNCPHENKAKLAYKPTDYPFFFLFPLSLLLTTRNRVSLRRKKKKCCEKWPPRLLPTHPIPSHPTPSFNQSTLTFYNLIATTSISATKHTARPPTLCLPSPNNQPVLLISFRKIIKPFHYSQQLDIHKITLRYFLFGCH